LMAAPVSDLPVLLAKFPGALVFYLVAWWPVVVYRYLLQHYSIDLPAVDPGVVGSTFLGMFLFGSFYMSLGCLASSLTRAQMVAAMNAFALGMGLFLLSLLPLVVAPRPGWQAKFFAHISMIEHMRDFTRGVVDTQHVIF